MLKDIIEKLRSKGCKITPQRRIIIQSLIKFTKFPTASELCNDIRQTNPEISLDTVYRNLNLLIDMGVVNQINLPGKDANVFELSLEGHHHHLVCLGCGAADCLDYCPVDEKELQKATGLKFEIIGHSLELYGYCEKCKALSK
ncbi:Fur family transcriptional regulator [Propionispora vibrioides]|uniref:Fur family transcriptional regulator, zinc uptake regulator n=1 Tax=Propionispora vibrioides TaxID=112903 RepID=A0A1H8XI74_9FIRM|nr:Fur family transcriptional regulator [Propionispora vibrioides]SEP39586.1 Fur family transcriptional regulator, zinc uptake regulator [Propionispora vibrioides]